MDDLFGLDDKNNDILGHLDDEALHEKHAWPGDLVELSEVIRAQLKREGVKDDKVYRQMERVLLAMSFLCGGRNFYLPRGKYIKIALRNKRIYDSFNGKNVNELGRQFNLTPQQIYGVLRKQRQLHRDRIQHNLFPEQQA